jgi:hypothetical protein
LTLKRHECRAPQFFESALEAKSLKLTSALEVGGPVVLSNGGEEKPAET